MKKVMILILSAGIFSACSENPENQANLAAKPASILLTDEKNKTVQQLNLSTGRVTPLISQGILSQPIDLKVIGDSLYILLSDTTSAVKKYNLLSGSWIGSTAFAGCSYAQEMTSDNSNLFISFQSSQNFLPLSLSGLTAGNTVALGQDAQGILTSGGKVYVCVSDGYSGGYLNSRIAVFEAGDLTIRTNYSVLKNPVFLSADSTAVYVSCIGSYSGDGGISMITGTTVTNLVINKSFSAIQIAGDKIYAAEYYNGLDIYMTNGAFVTNLLPGSAVNDLLLYNGYLYAEGNKTIYQIDTVSNYIVKTYANAVSDDSWGFSMDVYR